jgi:protein-tyrosine phosphatase
MRDLARLLVHADARDDARHEWRRRLRGEPDLPSGPAHRVLVCCVGNICRSPFAGALLADLRPDLAVRSAGFAAGEEAAADPVAIRMAARFSVDLTGHSARRLTDDDVAWADLILAMEGNHVSRLMRRWPQARASTRLLGDFLAEPPHSIEDPWGRSDEFFAFTFERIAEAVGRLALRIDARAMA